MGYNLFGIPEKKPGVQPQQPQQMVDAPSLEKMPTIDFVGNAPKHPTPVQPAANTAGAVANKPTPINPMSATDGIDNILQGLYTSKEEEERRRKASVANQRMLAVFDALRHVGNIYHTVQGATPQKYNDPVAEERARYEKGKALRDAANLKYLTYQQAKAAQDATQKKWEQQFALQTANAASQAAYRQEQARIAAERAANQRAYQEGSLSLRDKFGAAQQKERERHNRVAEKQSQQRIGIASQNAKNTQAYRQWKMNGGGGSGSGGGTLTFRGANGFYTKKMSSQDANAFYNQAFETLSKMRGANGRPIIDKNAVSGNTIPGIFGGNKINMQARKEAVDKAIYEHPEAGDLLRQQYEFAFDPRGAQQPSASQQQPNINFAPWNGGTSPNAYAPSVYTPDEYDDDDYDDLFDDEDLSGISI